MRENKFLLKMLFMSVYAWLLTKKQKREHSLMKFITVSELRNRATQIVTEIEKNRAEVIVTKNGKPVVLMRFITDAVFSLKEDEQEMEKKKGKDQHRGRAAFRKRVKSSMLLSP